MKNTIKKILKFISSRALYLLIGLFLALAIFGVQAAWNSTVSSGQPLTSALWNDVVAKLVELDNKNLSCTTVSATDSSAGNFDLSSSCAAGYACTGCSVGLVGGTYPYWHARPSGANGCYCYGWFGGGTVSCVSYCCKIE